MNVKKKKPKRKSIKPDGFSRVGVHETMLRDKLRTLSYKKAVEKNVRKNHLVLDIGCGTGILSFFAANKGCKKVYAVDRSDIIDSTEQSVQLNNFQNVITCVRGDILTFRPKQKVDIAIHEQIGSLLWDEDLVEKTVYVRKKILKPGGKLLPYKVDLNFVPVSYESVLEQSLRFWSRRQYGFDFSNLKTKAFRQEIRSALSPSIVDLKDTGTFLCREKCAYTVDLYKVKSIPHKIEVSFNLKRKSVVRGICAFFTIHLDKTISFSTKPRKFNTHWGQIFLPCFNTQKLKQDCQLNFTLIPDKKPEKWKFNFDFIPL